jgi:hypothetical protein
MARSVAALTLSWNDSNRSLVIAVSNVSLMIALHRASLGSKYWQNAAG